MTEPAGASQWFLCGFTAYSNDAKMRMLDVKVETLDRFGAVSEETAEEMCAGVLANSEATVAASITGVAGPVRWDIRKICRHCMLWLADKTPHSPY